MLSFLKEIKICLVLLSLTLPTFAQNNLLDQTTTEYWLRLFEEKGNNFLVEIKKGQGETALTDSQLRESVLALAEAISTDPYALTTVKFKIKDYFDDSQKELNEEFETFLCEKVLGKLLNRYNRNKWIEISGNKDINRKFQKKLMRKFIQSIGVKCIYGFSFKDYEIDEGDVLEICDRVSNYSEHLFQVNLAGSTLTFRSKENLINAFSEESCSVLYVTFFPIPHELSHLLCRVIKVNEYLREICLTECNFYEEEVLALAEALESNRFLKKLDLRSFKNLTLVGKKALENVENERKNKFEQHIKTKGKFLRNFSRIEETNPLVILYPDIADQNLNKNKGRSILPLRSTH